MRGEFFLGIKRDRDKGQGVDIGRSCFVFYYVGMSRYDVLCPRANVLSANQVDRLCLTQC